MIAGCFLAGHWRRLISHRLRNLGTDEVFYIRKILYKIGKKFIKACKRNVRNNTFGFPPKVFKTNPYRFGNMIVDVKVRRQPLIETGNLLTLMDVYPLPTDFLNPSVFAGYLKGARIHIANPYNNFRIDPILDAYTLVSILHNGKVISTTDKMVKHFIRYGYSLSKSTIIIPPRPFVTLTAESEDFLSVLAKEIGIYLGRVYTVNL